MRSLCNSFQHHCNKAQCNAHCDLFSDIPEFHHAQQFYNFLQSRIKLSLHQLVSPPFFSLNTLLDSLLCMNIISIWIIYTWYKHMVCVFNVDRILFCYWLYVIFSPYISLYWFCKYTNKLPGPWYRSHLYTILNMSQVQSTKSISSLYVLLVFAAFTISNTLCVVHLHTERTPTEPIITHHFGRRV